MMNYKMKKLGIVVFGAMLFFVFALIPANAQKKSKHWGSSGYGNRVDKDYRKAVRKQLKQHQQQERRDLHERQKWERRYYGNDRDLKNRQRYERFYLNRHQVREKKFFRDEFKPKRKKGYWN